MTIQVKTWKPENGCKSCKQAEKIMHEHTILAMQAQGKAIDKLKAQTQRIAELEAQVEAYLKEFSHIHVNRGDGTDTCWQCGFDLRDPIHIRYGQREKQT